MKKNKNAEKPIVTFLEQKEPVQEYGRALYAVGRSIIRAHLDSLSEIDLADLNTPRAEVRMRQMAKVTRIDKDKGARGDGLSGQYTKQYWARKLVFSNLYPTLSARHLPISNTLNRIRLCLAKKERAILVLRTQ
jgi:hypothetical protein